MGGGNGWGGWGGREGPLLINNRRAKRSGLRLSHARTNTRKNTHEDTHTQKQTYQLPLPPHCHFYFLPFQPLLPPSLPPSLPP